jgi:hypothetical protein
LADSCQTCMTQAGTHHQEIELHKTMILSNQNIGAMISSKGTQDLTSSRLTGWISKPRAFICQFLSTTLRVNPPKSKFFGAVACPKTDLEEFSHPFHSCLGVNSGSLRLLSISGGRRCLFVH